MKGEIVSRRPQSHILYIHNQSVDFRENGQQMYVFKKIENHPS